MLKTLFTTTVNRLFTKLVRHAKARLYADDVTRLASLYGTDKWNSHFYTPHYQRHFVSLRRKKLNILEIGIGGHKHQRAGGASLKVWKAFFPHSIVHGVDIEDKSFLQEKRGDYRGMFRNYRPIDRL